MSGAGTGKGVRYSKILSINSQDLQAGLGGGRSSNFVINLGQNLQGCVGISYKGCNFYNNMYNVRGAVTGNSNFNNLYVFGTVARPTIMLTQAPGFYSASVLLQSMINAMQAALLVGGPAVTATFSFSISPTSGLVTFNFLTSSTASDILTVPLQTTLGNQGFGVWQLLGFTSAFTIAVGGSATASQMPLLGGITQVNIESHALAPGNCYRENGQVSDWFQIIPVTAPFQGLNVDECKVDYLCEVSYDRPRPLNVIDIVLRDHDGNEINLNGSPFNLDIRTYYNDIV